MVVVVVVVLPLSGPLPPPPHTPTNSGRRTSLRVASIGAAGEDDIEDRCMVTVAIQLMNGWRDENRMDRVGDD